ncbi:type IV toxin-antitoxin system AbiEi family antitoxin domain-containing protein [Isoptericola sp. NPDC056573]|uniref:type IV toxin-antitoxin system AbiEi family antitoxin domain-containing protein n=1 Tax=Isoptericola sp. NPDC056573 TaxID=3345868 RepID=UPI0036C13E23
MPRRIVVPSSLGRLAALQEGLVSVAQCREHGLTDQQVAALVRQGRWRRAMLGVLDTGIPSVRGVVVTDVGQLLDHEGWRPRPWPASTPLVLST